MKPFNAGMIWNKADVTKLTAEQRRMARKAARTNDGILLPTGAALYFNRDIGERRLSGFWVKSYASSGCDSKPYCFS